MAEALMRRRQFALDAAALVAIFERHRGRSYQKVLSFSTIVHVKAEALLKHRVSAHRVIQRWEQEQALPASMYRLICAATASRRRSRK